MRNEEGILGSKKESYRDFHFMFRRNPVSSDVQSLDTEESIKQSVKLLVMTMFYERPFKPKIGSKIYGALFESWSHYLVSTVSTDIRKLLAQYEPRIVVQDIQVGGPETLDSNELSIRIEYLIVGKIKRVQQDIFLKRVR